MDRHEDLPDCNLRLFKQMRFNVEFTAETLPSRASRAKAECTPTINHGHAAFIENKRYRTKRRRTGDVVNPNAVFVYQTD
jgi:hypothetical protein